MRRTLLTLLCVSVVWTQVIQDGSKETQDASPRKEGGSEKNRWNSFLPDEAYLFDALEAMIPDASLGDNVMTHPDDAARFLLPPDTEMYQEKEGTRPSQQPEENITAQKLESTQSSTEVASSPGQPRRKRSVCLKCMMKKHGFGGGGGGGGYGGGQQEQQQQQQQVYIVQQPQQPAYHPQPQPQPQYHPQPQPQYHPQPQPAYHPQPQPQPQQKPQQCHPCGGGHPPNGGGGGGGYSQSSSNSQASSGGYGGGWGK